tara:strand:- start:367 stop:1050 length:684 start_codon:yes stop_codon:yes gene_type:complete
MPGLLDQIKNFASQQRENFRRAGERQRAGENRNPFLKSKEEQFNIANEMASNEPSPSSEYAPMQGIAKNTGYGLTQDMMRDFDPSNNESVLQLQKAMNAAGIKGADGKALSEDGIIGKNTMRALRFAQGQTDIADSPEARGMQSYGEPQGGVGPSYDNTYNEQSRDRGTRVANPSSNKFERFDMESGRRPRTVSVREGFGYGGRMGASGFSGKGSNYPKNKDSMEDY